ncbi:MAG: phosphopyruvate hydratase [Burkholderiaceae bacterium]
MNTKILSIRGFRIWDSRGRPTVEAEVTLANGIVARGLAPAGASRGSHEAIDLRDGGSAHGGFDVMRAVDNIERLIAPALLGRDAMDQAGIDRTLIALDGSANMARLGGNASTAVSMAVLQAAAAAQGLPLWRHLSEGRPVRMPLPEIQIFGGGAHAGRRVDVQDFLIMPVAATSFDEALSMCAEVYRVAGKLMRERGSAGGVADEGGWWPDFDSNEAALETLTRAIDRAGYGQGQVLISLDIAASEFGAGGRYKLGLEKREYDTAGWIEVLSQWIARYPIVSIEDPVAEDDEAGMRMFTEAFGDKVQVIGDDFLVTNAERVRHAVAGGCCNAVLLKPNQAGTITATYEALLQAQTANWGTVVSARSGETEDTFITHLAVGWNAGQLKVGSFARSERMAKWNEGLRIERGGQGLDGFAGAAALPVQWKGR